MLSNRESVFNSRAIVDPHSLETKKTLYLKYQILHNLIPCITKYQSNRIFVNFIDIKLFQNRNFLKVVIYERLVSE